MENDWFVDTRSRSTGAIISRMGPMPIEAAKRAFWSLFEAVDYDAIKVEVIKRGEDVEGWERTQKQLREGGVCQQQQSLQR
jgi:hypothetical protein